MLKFDVGAEAEKTGSSNKKQRFYDGEKPNISQSSLLAEDHRNVN